MTTAVAHVSMKQLKRLGERLRKSSPASADDFVALRKFRETHLPMLVRGLEEVQAATLGRECWCSGRLKNTATIVEKLVRSKTRLGAMQDIAGIRVVLAERSDRGEQDHVVEALRRMQCFVKQPDVLDRRDIPTHGYRAVHITGQLNITGGTSSRWIEIQVRTHLQHLWAQIYERIADEWNRGIRYGEAPHNAHSPVRIDGAPTTRQEFMEYLRQLSQHIDDVERWRVLLEGVELTLITGKDGQDPRNIDSVRQSIQGEMSATERQLHDAKSMLAAAGDFLIKRDAAACQQAAPQVIHLGDERDHGVHLVVYSRTRGVVMERYVGKHPMLISEWSKVDARYADDNSVEVVLLIGNWKKTLELTHARYFGSTGALAGG